MVDMFEPKKRPGIIESDSANETTTYRDFGEKNKGVDRPDQRRGSQRTAPGQPGKRTR